VDSFIFGLPAVRSRFFLLFFTVRFMYLLLSLMVLDLIRILNGLKESKQHWSKGILNTHFLDVTIYFKFNRLVHAYRNKSNNCKISGRFIFRSNIDYSLTVSCKRRAGINWARSAKVCSCHNQTIFNSNWKIFTFCSLAVKMYEYMIFDKV